MSQLHYLPPEDVVEHEPDYDCVCGPRVELVLGTDDELVFHVSLDGRIAGCDSCREV